MQGHEAAGGGSVHTAHHLDLVRSQAQMAISIAPCPGTNNITGLSCLPACLFQGSCFPSPPTPSVMTSPPVLPDAALRQDKERGRNHFSATEEKVLREYLEDFRRMSKEERKDLLMFKIYRLMKAAGPQLTPEQWRIRKKVAVTYLGYAQ